MLLYKRLADQLFREILILCPGPVDQAVHRLIEPRFTVIVAVGLLVQRAVGLVTEALKLFSQVTRPDIGAATGRFGFGVLTHVLHYRRRLEKRERKAPAMGALPH